LLFPVDSPNSHLVVTTSDNICAGVMGVASCDQ
jgi:hypothetical protein